MDRFTSSYPKKHNSKYTEISNIKELGYLDDDIPEDDIKNPDFIKNNIAVNSVVVLNNGSRVKIKKIFGNLLVIQINILETKELYQDKTLPITYQLFVKL